MGVETCHIRTTDTADKLHLTKNFSCIVLWRKRAVTILSIMGRNQDIFGNFDKFCIITALLTDNTSCGFAGGNLDFLHKLIRSNLLSVINYGVQLLTKMARGACRRHVAKELSYRKQAGRSQWWLFIGFDPGYNRIGGTGSKP